jgi:ribonuclease P protein component
MRGASGMAFATGRRIGPALSTIGRLKRRPDFLAAAAGRRFHTERMTAQGRLRDAAELRDAPADGLHLGFTITKRVGHATERNRIRRRLRGALAQVGGDLPSLPADIVLIARRPALHAPFDALCDDLRRAVGTVTKPRSPDAKPRSPVAKGGRAAKAAPGGSTAPTTPATEPVAEPSRPSSSPANACAGSHDG